MKISEKINLVPVIRGLGWSGIILSILAIGTKNIPLYLVAQVVATLSSFVWSIYLQGKKITIDLLASLVLSIVAAMTKDQFWMYTAMVCRSVQYQLLFERVVKTKNKIGE